MTTSSPDKSDKSNNQTSGSKSESVKMPAANGTSAASKTSEGPSPVDSAGTVETGVGGKGAPGSTLAPSVDALRVKGNEYFKKKRYDEAVQCYSDAIAAIKCLDNFGDEGALAKLHSNRAA